ncbi:MAG: hypothetical protein IJ105_00870 [Bacilli bacterium]|nr:hypothetical protein [Bacilli bacterium]
MIDFNIEFTKGVLFIRLFGSINKFNEIEIKNDIIDVIKSGGIRYLVFNLEDLEIEEEVDLFNECENIIKDNDGQMLICGNYNGNYIDRFNYVEDELSAYKEFSIC